MWSATLPEINGGVTTWFQSTRPVWSATRDASRVNARIGVSIHAPRVERDSGSMTVKDQIGVSIHAPRVERDVMAYALIDWQPSFQSTRPVWSAT